MFATVSMQRRGVSALTVRRLVMLCLSCTPALALACFPDDPEGAQELGSSSAKPEIDINGDGHTDLVWQRQSTGERGWPVRFWLMHDKVRLAEVPLNVVPDNGQRLAAVGDFGSCFHGVVNPAPDGHPDLVFRGIDAGSPNQTWFLEGSDLVYQNCRVPHRNPDGTSFIASGSWANPSVGLVISAADLGTINGSGGFEPKHDRLLDLLWVNKISYNLVTHVMYGATKLLGSFMDPPSPIDASSWDIVGTIDLANKNGRCGPDGFADLFWQNVSSKRMVAWYLGEDSYTISRNFGDFINRNGPFSSDGFFVSPDGSPVQDWRVVAMGDYNGDGYADLLHQSVDGSAASGRLFLWHMRGPNRIDAGEFLGPMAEPDLNWKLVAPR